MARSIEAIASTYHEVSAAVKAYGRFLVTINEAIGHPHSEITDGLVNESVEQPEIAHTLASAKTIVVSPIAMDAWRVRRRELGRQAEQGPESHNPAAILIGYPRNKYPRHLRPRQRPTDRPITRL